MTIYTPKKSNVKIHFSLTSSPSQLIYANALEIQDTGIYVIYDNTYDDMIHIHGNKIFIDFSFKPIPFWPLSDFCHIVPKQSIIPQKAGLMQARRRRGIRVRCLTIHGCVNKIHSIP